MDSGQTGLPYMSVPTYISESTVFMAEGYNASAGLISCGI